MGWETDANPEISRMLNGAVEYFGLGIAQSHTRVGGDANKNYSLETSSGSYILKVILEHPIEDIETEIDYLKRIQEFNFPSSSYVRSQSGSSIYQDQDQMVLVLPKLDGNIPERTADVCRVIGENLAKLHQIPTDSLPTRNGWLRRSYLPQAIATLNEKVPNQAQRITQAYQNLKDFPYSELPQVLVHGDMASENCLFKDAKLVAFLDWEEVGIAPAILDLSICLLNFCFEENQLHPELFQAMIEGYTKQRELTNIELKNLPEALRLACLIQCAWRYLQFGVYHPDPKYIGSAETYWQIDLDNFQIPAKI